MEDNKQQPNTNNIQTQDKPKKKTAIYVLIGCAGLIALCGLCGIIGSFSGSNNSSDTTSSSNTSVTETPSTTGTPTGSSITTSTPTPTVASKQYTQVFTFTANGAKKSDTFTVTGEKFKIKYDCAGSLCQAFLKSPNNDLSIDLIMNTASSTKDESIFYKPGTYFIDSNILGKATFIVEDYK